MAHLRFDFRSDAMGMNTPMTVISPEKAGLSQVPVVYLLHEPEDNRTGWARISGLRTGRASTAGNSGTRQSERRWIICRNTKGKNRWTLLQE